MENLHWIFDGIGTEILSAIIGGVIGGLAGYVIGVKNSAKQNQKARNDAKQTQEFEIENVINNDDKVHNTLRQK